VATSVPAACFALADRGRIAPGLRADLLLVDGDRTSDIVATRNIRAIWRSGSLFDRDAYRTRLHTRQSAGERQPTSQTPLVRCVHRAHVTEASPTP
jgi:adenine deaminase